MLSTEIWMIIKVKQVTVLSLLVRREGMVLVGELKMTMRLGVWLVLRLQVKLEQLRLTEFLSKRWFMAY